MAFYDQPHCARCNNLKYATDGLPLRIYLPKFRLDIEGDLDWENSKDRYLGPPNPVTCKSCQLLWDGAAAVFGPQFYKGRNFMIVDYVGPEDRGGPMSLYLVSGQSEVELQFYMAHGK